MIGVASHREGENDHPRRKVADVLDHQTPGFFRVLQVCIRQSSIPPLRYAEDLGRTLCLFRSERCATPGTGLSGGQVQDPDLVSGIDGLQKSARAGELDVVSVGGEGQDVHGHGGI